MAVKSEMEFTPELYPQFPSTLPGYDFPIASLETISLKKLQQDNETTEQHRLLEACKSQGFFYLDLTGCNAGQTIFRGAHQVAQIAEKAFKLSEQEKLKYVYQAGDLFGYKRIGLTKVDENSTPDTAEFFSISKDVICKTSSCSDASAVPYPEEITSAAPLLAEYMHTAHSVGLRILQILFQHLGVPGSAEVIASRHAFDQVAGDHVRMIRGPARRDAALPEIQTPAHTDFGSVTVLMNWLGGLQMWSEGSSSAVREAIPGKGAEAGKWLWVRPQANCAIINLGDAAGKFSNGVLRSGRHRVVPAPGEQGLWPRYSVVYFVRPNDECVLRTLEGSGIPARRNRGGEGAGDEDEDEEITAKEWIFRQAERLRNGKR